ncbi:hypothetical protein OK18_08260 [Chryseobacterium gallinarum]|uniref:Uncharacterized protein n=2 Tax=Chryseobacterium TaxID=59732 RepID=A0A0G3M187_CHRGL|nr:hypothetical protein [Chryseobacterium gallinarum]AKK72619.1 hypothetical protein OK18_08260 [Chryseobacterium gallinarum]
MVKRYIILLGLLSVNSCISQNKLKDGTKVPSSSYIFSNKKNFSSNILNHINTNHLYELKATYMCDYKLNIKRKLSLMGAYYLQFYNNGEVRFMDALEPNPNVTGYRGVIYVKNGNFYIDKAAPVYTSGKNLDIHKYFLKVDGDSLLLREDNSFFRQSEYILLVYKKSGKIPENWKKYKADW